PTDPAEAKRREVVRYRRTVARGAAGRRFAESVKAVYDYRCAFCAGRYPKLDSSPTSGVDGAHILPFAMFDLNSIVNGLCLCKECHWAFDNGVLRLDYTKSSKRYVLSIPKVAKDEAKSTGFDLTRFNGLTGPLSTWKLPADPALWPNPTYLAELNTLIYS